MKLKQFIGIAMLLGGMVCTALPVSAQESREWAQNEPNFAEDIPIFKIRWKNNGGSTGFLDVSEIYLQDTVGKRTTINAKKFTINGRKMKNLPVDSEGWTVYEPDAPVYMSYEGPNELCYNNFQFYVNSADIAEARKWENGYTGFPKESCISKIRYKHRPYSADGIELALEDEEASRAFSLTYNSLENKYEYRGYGNIENQIEINGWTIITFNTPMFVSWINAWQKDTYGVYSNANLNKKALLAYEVQLYADDTYVAPDPNAIRGVTLSVYDKTPEEPGFTTPEAAGYTVVESANIEGVHFDRYAEGVFFCKFSDGDYATFTDESFTTHRGDWRATSEEGYVVTYKDGIASVELPGGYKLVKYEDTGFYQTDKGKDIRANWRSLIGGLLYMPGQEEPLKYVDYYNRNSKYNGLFSILSNESNEKGYLLGDRIYRISDDGEVYAARQLIDNVPYPAFADETIESVTVENPSGYRSLVLNIKYTNGDYLNWNGHGDQVESCRLHRNGGILTVKWVNNKSIQTLELPNGDKYIGSFLGSDPHIGFNISHISQPRLTYYDGTLITKSGENIQYKGGQSAADIAAKKAAEEAENEKLYQDFCKKYGKKYVDAALNADVIPGMPEELMLSIQWFTFEICYSSGQTKVYRIRGIGMRGNTLSDRVVKGYAWVTNGKVTQITTNPPR